tara:strand:- start:1914 stop:3152 length:1239 start_codon:yes stop_codon:yes gene_type:complete
MNDLYGNLDEKRKKRKKAGTESSKESSLRDWFGRKGAKGKKKGWVDCNAPDGKGGYKSCGRSGGEKRKKYPACRPTPGACKERGKGKSWGKKAKKKKNEEISMKLSQIVREELEIVMTEAHTKEQEKELEKISDELAGASKMHKSQSDRIKKLLDQTDDKELKEEEAVSEGMNCGCGQDPCKTYGKDNEKLIVMVREELEAVLDEKKKKKKKKKSSGKKDACYHKVRSRYKVWPSAYASGALVKCRKVGAKNWGNSKKESVEIMLQNELYEVLTESSSKDVMRGYKDWQSGMSKPAEPDNLEYMKGWETAEERFGMYREGDEEHAAVLGEKKKKPCKPSKGKRFAKRVNGKCRSFGQKGQAKGGGDRIRPGTKKGDAYCARSAKIKKCKNPPCANDLSRKKWKCRGSKSMKE